MSGSGSHGKAKASEPSAKQELELLERVLTRLAVAEEANLSKVLGTFLVPVINKMASTHEATRKKVMEILSHVNKRIRGRAQVQLPMADLVDVYTTAGTPAMVQNFAVTYIQLGITRVSPDEQKKLFPPLLLALHKRPAQHRDILLFQVAFPALGSMSAMPTDSDTAKVEYPFVADDDTRRVFLDYARDLLLNQPASTGPVRTPQQLMQQQRESAAAAGTPVAADADAAPVVPSGLTPSRHRAMASIDNDALLRIKLGLLRFLGSVLFFPYADDVFPLMVLASVDPHHEVVRLAEDGLRRHGPLNIESPVLIKQMYAMFLGTLDADKTTPAADRRRPTNPQQRIKLIRYLRTAKRAANSFPATLQAIFESLYSPNTTTKLRLAGMELLSWTIMHATDEQFKPFGVVLRRGVAKLLKELADKQDADNKLLRGFSYTALGHMARRAPELFNSDVSWLTLFFAATSDEEQSVRAMVREGLTLLTGAYAKNLTADMSPVVEQLLLTTVVKDEPAARFSAVQAAVRLFPYKHVLARYVCLLAASDSKLDVREEAKRGLTPFVWSKDNDWIADETAEAPEFAPLMDMLLMSAKLDEKKPSNGPTAWKPATFQDVIEFASRVLHIHIQRASDPATYVDGILESPGMAAFQRLLDAALVGKDVPLRFAAVSAVLGLVAHAPTKLTAVYVRHLETLRALLHQGRPEDRERAGKLIGFLARSMSSADLNSVLTDVRKRVADRASRRSDITHGALWVLGYVTGQSLQYRGGEATSGSVQVLLPHLLSTDNELVIAALGALRAIGRCGVLPLALGTKEAAAPKDEEAAAGMSADAVTRWTVVRTLSVLSRHKLSKIAERSLLTAASLLLGEPKAEFRDAVTAIITDLAKVKSEELHFSAGEALSLIGAGWRCAASKDEHFEQPNDALARVDETTAAAQMTTVLDLTLAMFPDAHPIKRMSGGIWLMSLLNFAGQHPVISKRLMEIQAAFSRLLNDPNDITQEVASKGMSLVYENGDEDTRKLLVSELVETLTTGKRAKLEVSADTQLFAPGELGGMPARSVGDDAAAGGEAGADGTGGDSGGLSTYKELCGVAADLGQPDLIYKFLDLARNHSMWNSMRGAAFGLISAGASKELEPYMASLVPKLYRYQYDPNEKIRLAMTRVWHGFVGEPKKTVDKHFAPIFNELTTGMGARLWRTREASALGLADLLPGRTMAKIDDAMLKQLWVMTFRGLDDVKETVRLAAKTLSRAVANLSRRLCDPALTGSRKDVNRALAVVLPMLLHTGLVDRADEVKQFALKELMSIARHGGTALKPHLPELVAVLLESLSALEPQQLTYAQFHAQAVNMSQEQLEGARAMMSRVTPMAETLELCVRQVDADVMPEIVPRLKTLIRTGVGLPTRTGIAKFILSLCRDRPEVVKPHTADLLAAVMKNGIKDRSVTVRRMFAAALASLARLSDVPTVAPIIDTLVTWWVKDDDQIEERQIAVVGVVFREISRNAGDMAKAFATSILPLAFLAQFDPSSEEAAAPWKEIWDEGAAGTNAGLRLYMPEVVALVPQLIASARWNLKRAAGLAMTAANKYADEKVCDMLAEPLLPVLMTSLAGRTWDGKADVLAGVAALAIGGKAYVLRSDPALAVSILELLTRECKKRDKRYRHAALKALADVAAGLAERADVFDTAAPVILETLVGRGDSDDEAERDVDQRDAEAEHQTSKQHVELRRVAFLAYGAVFPAAGFRAAQAKHAADALTLVCKELRASSWTVAAAGYKALSSVLSKLAPVGDANPASFKLSPAHVQEHVLPAVRAGLDNAKYAQVRVGALNAIEALADAAPAAVLAPHLSEVRAVLKQSAQDRSPDVKMAAERVASHAVFASS